MYSYLVIFGASVLVLFVASVTVKYRAAKRREREVRFASCFVNPETRPAASLGAPEPEAFDQIRKEMEASEQRFLQAEWECGGRMTLNRKLRDRRRNDRRDA